MVTFTLVRLLAGRIDPLGQLAVRFLGLKVEVSKGVNELPFFLRFTAGVMEHLLDLVDVESNPLGGLSLNLREQTFQLVP